MGRVWIISLDRHFDTEQDLVVLIYPEISRPGKWQSFLRRISILEMKMQSRMLWAEEEVTYQNTNLRFPISNRINPSNNLGDTDWEVEKSKELFQTTKTMTTTKNSNNRGNFLLHPIN